MVTTDAAHAGRLTSAPAGGSVVVAPVGRAQEPWTTLRPAELLAGLTPTA